MDFTTKETIYYGSCFAIGFIVGACRLIRDREYQSASHTIVAAATCGSFSFAVVALLDNHWGDDVDNPWVGLAIATILGLGSKLQDKILRALINYGLKKVGLTIDDLDKQ